MKNNRDALIANLKLNLDMTTNDATLNDSMKCAKNKWLDDLMFKDYFTDSYEHSLFK